MVHSFSAPHVEAVAWVQVYRQPTGREGVPPPDLGAQAIWEAASHPEWLEARARNQSWRHIGNVPKQGVLRWADRSGRAYARPAAAFRYDEQPLEEMPKFKTTEEVDEWLRHRFG